MNVISPPSSLLRSVFSSTMLLPLVSLHSVLLLLLAAEFLSSFAAPYISSFCYCLPFLLCHCCPLPSFFDLNFNCFLFVPHASCFLFSAVCFPTFFFFERKSCRKGVNASSHKTAALVLIKHSNPRGENRSSPSDPPPYRNPSKEAANALAAAQHRSPAHLNLHACSALLRKITGSHLARAFARRVRNCLVSSDHRPPTSPTRTTNRALPRGLTSSGRFSPSYAWPQPRLLHPRGRPGDAQNRHKHECGVHRQFASEQGQPVCQDLDSSSVLGIWICQVKISEHGIRDHSATCLPADASPGALHSKPPPPQESCPRRSSVVAKNAERTATPTLRRELKLIGFSWGWSLSQ